MARTPLPTKPPRRRSTGRPITEKLYKGQPLFRAYSQPPGTPPRAVAFNPKSAGRASPVCDSEGNVDAAMYVSLNEPFGAVREMLFHTILKHYPFGGLVASALFDEVYIAELQVLSPLKLISIPSMEHRRVIRPEFGAPRKDHYEDTQKDAQDLYGRHPTAVGLAWSSARGLSYSAVLYESRVPADSIALAAPSRRLKDDPGLWDYTVQVLADHGIRVGTP